MFHEQKPQFCCDSCHLFHLGGIELISFVEILEEVGIKHTCCDL